jgi:cytoskeletal protein RodZ
LSAGKENPTTTVIANDLCERRVLFGIDLKKLRESQNLSTFEVAEKTRINIEYIECLEQGKFERLPGKLFGRGFITALLKHYSSAQGDYLTRYDELWENDGIHRSISDSTKRRLGSNSSQSVTTYFSSKKLAHPAQFILGLLLLVGLAGAAYFISKKGGSYFSSFISSQKSSETTSEIKAKSVTPAPILKAPEATVAALPTTDISSDGEIAVQPPVTNRVVIEGQQRLSITVLEPVKIKIESDDGKPVIKDFVEGTYDYSFETSADLLIYDAAAVKISFNGNPLGSLGNKGRIRRIGFRADGPDQKTF